MTVTLEDIFASLPPPPILAISGKFMPVDLSSGHLGLTGRDASAYLTELAKGGDILFGGYAEKRSLYGGFGRFQDRDRHIGIDIWAKEGTAVLVPYEGKVHSFAYNAGEGNYGPTIILEHQSGSHVFYTLYGHLDFSSIEELEMDDHFRTGDTIGHIGSEKVNGGYLPHLHFQIIRNLENHCGDYPGVCSEADLPHYLSNCPDPNLLLKLT